MRGSTVSVLSPRPEEALKLASLMGKASERGPLAMFYRKTAEDFIVSTLVPSNYPNSVLDAASAASLSDLVIVSTGYELDWKDGELLTLAHVTAAQKAVVTPIPEKVSALIERSGMGRDFRVLGEDPSVLSQAVGSLSESDNLGFIFVDQGFNVKGVGTVVLGITKMPVKVHDVLKLLPSMKTAEVRSIEVLDEPFDGVGSGVRVGLALKGVEVEDAKNAYMLVPEDSKACGRLEGSVTLYPWSERPQEGGLYHIAAGGVTVPAILERLTNSSATFKLQRPLPRLKHYIVLNVNARPGRSRVLGSLKGPGGEYVNCG